MPPELQPNNIAVRPALRLRPVDVAFLIVGIVIGAGIFRVPTDIAAATGSASFALGMWLAGGLAAICGALCYAELASRYPSIGGEYHFIRLAWGAKLAGLFLWCRITVMQTASIASVAFVAGDYAASLWVDSPPPAIWAGATIIAVTVANLIGIEAGRKSQILFVIAELLAIASILFAASILGFSGEAPLGVAKQTSNTIPIGLALVLVMMAYGGWNEAAYVSAEIQGGPNAIVKALIFGLGLVTLLYLLVNAALLYSLGTNGLSHSSAPAMHLASAAFGPVGYTLIGLSVVTAALSTLNATVITGARAMCAGGQHLPAFGFLSKWDDKRSTPVPALLLQAAIALALTAYGATTRDGFVAMVAFGAPVFWLFLALTTASLFRLRRRFPQRSGFAVPLYPLVPILFLVICAFMLWSAVEYAWMLFQSSEEGRLAGLLGIGLLMLGLPIAWKAQA